MKKVKSVAAAKKEYKSWPISALGAMTMVRNSGVLVYKDRTPADSKKLKNTLQKEAEDIINRGHYKTCACISNEEHIANIKTLARRVTNQCGHFLSGDKLKFGMAQKYLNVELKRRWCSDGYPKPPHCPFDGVVLRALGPEGACDSWLLCDHPKCYAKWLKAFKDNKRRLIRELREEGVETQDVKTMADWEIIYWSRNR